MNNPINSLLNQLLAKRPDVAGNPRYMEMINIIKNNDSKKGQEIANNLCETYGVSKEDALAQAKSFFGLK